MNVPVYQNQSQATCFTKHMPGNIAATYDVIQSSTKTKETEDVNAEEEMQNTENDNSVTKKKLQKRIGCY